MAIPINYAVNFWKFACNITGFPEFWAWLSPITGSTPLFSSADQLISFSKPHQGLMHPVSQPLHGKFPKGSRKRGLGRDRDTAHKTTDPPQDRRTPQGLQGGPGGAVVIHRLAHQGSGARAASGRTSEGRRGRQKAPRPAGLRCSTVAGCHKSHNCFSSLIFGRNHYTIDRELWSS